jgi:hypothetical protein
MSMLLTYVFRERLTKIIDMLWAYGSIIKFNLQEYGAIYDINTILYIFVQSIAYTTSVRVGGMTSCLYTRVYI